MYSLTPDDGRKVSETCRVLLKINIFMKMVHLAGFTIVIYYDVRTYERQTIILLNKNK